MTTPKDDRTIHINLHVGINRRQLKGLLALGLLFAAERGLDSESLTLTTSYPAPSGVYQSMVVTGQATLARDPGGSVTVGAVGAPGTTLDRAGNIAANGSITAIGNVGIGTAVPGTKLDVRGNAQILGNALVSGGKLTVADGTQSNGYVFTSNAAGQGSWLPVRGISNLSWYTTWALGPNYKAIGTHDFCALHWVANVWASQAVICEVYPTGGSGPYTWTLYEDSDPAVGLAEGCGAVCIN